VVTNENPERPTNGQRVVVSPTIPLWPKAPGSASQKRYGTKQRRPVSTLERIGLSRSKTLDTQSSERVGAFVCALP